MKGRKSQGISSKVWKEKVSILSTFNEMLGFWEEQDKEIQKGNIISSTCEHSIPKRPQRLPRKPSDMTFSVK